MSNFCVPENQVLFEIEGIDESDLMCYGGTHTAIVKAYVYVVAQGFIGDHEYCQKLTLLDKKTKLLKVLRVTIQHRYTKAYNSLFS